MTPELLLGLLMGTVVLSAPLILAALGGLCSERSGVINIGLEGTMLGSACAGALVSQASGSAVIGLLSALLTGVCLSLLHGILTQAYRIDHIVSGMAINALAAGGTSLISKKVPELASQQMAALPLAAYYVLAWTAVVGVWWYVKSTRGGLRLLAVGNDPDKARQMGVQPRQVRYMALVWTGVFCGLGGLVIATNAGSYSENMTAGRGYIALAALILGGWRAPQAFMACIGFAFFQALELNLQGTATMGLTLPAEFWHALPYLVTLLALAGFLGKGRAPAGLGRP